MSLSTAEAAVIAAPDDDAAWQVYADALQAAGDPRGELIALQRKLAAGYSVEAAARQNVLIQANAEHWLFEDAAELLLPTRLTSGEGAPLDVEWKNGFPVRITLQGVRYGSDVAYPGHGEAWLDLMREPRNLRFVREVVFGAPSSGDEPNWDDAVEAITAHVPPLLRSLRFDRGDYWDISSTTIEGLGRPFWAAMKNLEQLSFEIGTLGFEDIDLPKLREFEVVSSGFDVGCMDAVRRARWPELQRLSLYLGDPNYGGIDDVGPVVTLLEGVMPAKLTHLGLCNAMFADELPRVILGSKWLERLKSLDLSDGAFGEQGARTLLENADRFRHLQLDLSRAYLSDEVMAELRTAFPTVVLDDPQGEAELDDRYVSVSE